MVIILLLVLLFGCTYFLFKRYLVGHGMEVGGLAKDIARAYIGAGGVGIIVLFISIPFFLSTASKSDDLIELLSFVVWGSGFVIPLIVFLQKKTRVPLWYTVAVVLIPLAITITSWILIRTTPQQVSRFYLYHYVDESLTESMFAHQASNWSINERADHLLRDLFVVYLPNLKSEYLDVKIVNGVATVNFRPGAKVYLNASSPGISAEYTNSIRKTLSGLGIEQVQFAIEGEIIKDWDA